MIGAVVGCAVALFPAAGQAVCETADTYVSVGTAPRSIVVNGHEFVDLGLPSGLLWATCNVGASTPYEGGEYFAWGETAARDVAGWNNYKWCNGSDSKLTKYCSNFSYGYNGFVDSKVVLDAEDDAATANWGAGCRMPSYAEFAELDSVCTWVWSSSHKGYTVKGTNGNSIFLPASNAKGADGSYWSATLKSSNAKLAHNFYFKEGLHTPDGFGTRPFMMPVRPVADM